MNFRNFAGFGKSFFSRSKNPFSFTSTPVSAPKTSFMTKMTHKQVSNLIVKSTLPLTASGLVLRNLTQLLQKRQSSLIQMQRLLNCILGVGIEQGIITGQPNLIDWNHDSRSNWESEVNRSNTFKTMI